MSTLAALRRASAVDQLGLDLDRHKVRQAYLPIRRNPKTEMLQRNNSLGKRQRFTKKPERANLDRTDGHTLIALIALLAVLAVLAVLSLLSEDYDKTKVSEVSL